MPPPIHDAVTAVLVHGSDVFITRRSPQIVAFGGYWAFPGGKVDRTDTDAPFAHPLLAAHPPRLLRALARELYEEIGFDLERAAADGEVAALECFGEVTTPPFVPTRFRTWFFRIELTRRPDFQLDGNECTEGQWVAPAVLCERFRQGRLLAAPPTRIVLEAFACEPQTRPDFSFEFDPATQIPWIEVLRGLRVLLVRSNTIPPADRTNCFWVGGDGHPRVLIDPSPANREELARLTKLLDGFGVDLVFLTHHHPDHNEFADDIARRYGVPLGMSADTRARIARRSPKFFDGVETRIFGDGDVLTHWLGEPVRLYAVPGHDEGQLAPMPESRAWCIVSDLIQGVGTVVVGAPEGDMAKYFASLQKIIDLDPAVIIPSHGMACGGTWRLQETLQHRRQREAQVRALHESGKSVDEMLPLIYSAVDPRLLPLAKLNIESHLKKLRAEGAIA